MMQLTGVSLSLSAVLNISEDATAPYWVFIFTAHFMLSHLSNNLAIIFAILTSFSITFTGIGFCNYSQNFFLG